WGGYDYENCAELTGMIQKLGPTRVAAPVVYLSYDYGAPLTESRVLCVKMRQTTPFPPCSYWTNQNTLSSLTVVNFGLNVLTSIGNLTIPNVQPDGRQSKIIITYYTFGNSSLLYSSAEVLTYAVVDESEVLVLYLNQGQAAEFVLENVIETPTVYGDIDVTTQTFKDTQTKLSYTQTSGKTVLQFKNGPQIWLVDHITGNLNQTTTIEIFAPKSINSFRWNGKHVLNVTKTACGTLIGSFSGPESSNVTLPGLDTLTWKYYNSHTEKFTEYYDSNWTLANHTTTSNPTPPDTLPVLHTDDYGFHLGYKLYRGYFDGTNVTRVNITMIRGDAFGGIVWVNGNFLSNWTGSPNDASGTLEVDFTDVALNATRNVVFVVHDYQGHDQDSVSPYGPRNPRGISHASLEIDNVRCVYNEGGLRAERLGWILPGFDDGDWEEKSPLAGVNGAGIKFYCTTVDLILPTGHNIPLAVLIGAPNTTKAQIQIYVNGDQYRKYISHIGPQTTFPIPPGIINNQKKDVLGVSIWAQESTGAQLETLSLIEVSRFTSSFDFAFDAGYLQPGWDEGRLEYL
ncbi:hypothetical protein RUND412_001124, partial [Rhizina undulata]